MIQVIDLCERRAIPVVDLTVANVHFDATANVYVAYCPALDFYTQGYTALEARAACAAGVAMLVNLSRDHGMPLPIPGGWRPAKAKA